MNNQIQFAGFNKNVVAAKAGLLIAGALMLQTVWAGVLPPNSKPFGRSYDQWVVDWWRAAQQLTEDPDLGEITRSMIYGR